MKFIHDPEAVHHIRVGLLQVTESSKECSGDLASGEQVCWRRGSWLCMPVRRARDVMGSKARLISSRWSDACFVCCCNASTRMRFVLVAQYHNTVRRAIAGRSTPEAMEVSDECSPLFESTVLLLLELTRPLSFTFL